MTVSFLVLEPTSVDLRIDGETDPCSQGKDINFFFRGYTVSGKVSGWHHNQLGTVASKCCS